MSKKRLRIAQIQVLRWLQGRIEDQFVKAYISNEIALLERIGYPINDRGTELTFEKKQKAVKQLPGQTNIMEALENGERTEH